MQPQSIPEAKSGMPPILPQNTASKAADTVESDKAVQAAIPGSLPEFRHYTPRAGHPDWPRLAAEARELAAELLPTLDKPKGGPQEWKRRIASYKTLGRNYIDNRRLVQQGREDLRPLYFIWTTLRTCNFACTYCDDHTGRKYPDLPNEGVLDTDQGKRLLEVMRTRTSSVYFAGGEPTIRKDLPELTRHARSLDYYPIIINTNGSLLHRQLRKPDWKDWLTNMDIIIVSLDALHIDTLNKMWVYKRSEEVIRNLLMLRELSQSMGFKLMVNTVIQPDTLAEASDVLDFANDMGICFCPVPVNVGPVVNPELKGQERFQKLADTILARKKAGFGISGSARMNRRLLNSEPLNCRNTVKPHIDFDGRLAWPCKSTVNVKPHYLNVLDYDDVDSLYGDAVKLVDPTRFHGPAANQCGANCNWAQNYTTDTYVHGLQHPTSLLRDVLDFVRG